MIQTDAASLPSTQIPSLNTFLSLAQIHRALRPLRTKLLALSKSITAASAKSRGKQTSVSAFQERNRLAIVPHPSRFQFSTRSSSVLSEWDPASLELDTGLPIIDFARKAHAISDAFRNVVARAYGDEMSKRTGSIPSLMEITTVLLGDDIEASVMERLRANRPLNSDDSTFEIEDDDEEDETYIIDGCYEQIPEHIRRWALVPHAVKMILIRAPNSPTILETCLDIALEHGSTRDALCFLRRVLSLAFTRRASDDIPIRSSQHGDYLVHLLRKPNQSSRPITFVWSDLQFTEEVISAISRVDLEDQEELWCSIAVKALFSAVSEAPKLCLVAAFAAFCAGPARGRFGKRQLRTWVEQILCVSVLFQTSQTFEYDTERDLEEVDLGACLNDISVSMGAWVDAGPLSSVAEFFRDAFICIAVHTLSISYPDKRERSKSARAIVTLLSPLASTTSPSSFNPLMSAFSEAFPAPLDVPRCVDLALSHARSLQEEGLHRMEAALLAAALNALENEETPAASKGEAANQSVCSLHKMLAEAEARCVEKDGDGAGMKWRYDEDHGWVTATPAAVPKVPPREPFPSLSRSTKRKRLLRIEDEEEGEGEEENPHGPSKRLQIQTTPYLEKLDRSWGSSPDPMHLNTPSPGPRTALSRGITNRQRNSLGKLSSLSCQLAMAGEGEEIDDEAEAGEGDAETIESRGEPISLLSGATKEVPFMDVEQFSLSSTPSSPHFVASPRRNHDTPENRTTQNLPPGDAAPAPSPNRELLPPPVALSPPNLAPRRLLNLPIVPRTAGRGMLDKERDSLPPRLAQALRRISSSGSLSKSGRKGT